MGVQTARALLSCSFEHATKWQPQKCGELPPKRKGGSCRVQNTFVSEVQLRNTFVSELSTADVSPKGDLLTLFGGLARCIINYRTNFVNTPYKKFLFSKNRLTMQVTITFLKNILINLKKFFYFFIFLPIFLKKLKIIKGRNKNPNDIKLKGFKKSPLLFDKQRTFDLDIYPYKLTFMSLLFF